MNNIFEKLKKTYNPNENTLDYEKAFKFDNNSTLIEEQLQYLILKKRYDNLGRFLKNQTQDYENLDIEGLQNLLFFYNDLKEINFIGTDLYANTLFIKNTVPFLLSDGTL